MPPTDDPATAACGYWERRGLPTAPTQVVTAPGAPLLLLAVLVAAGRAAGGRDGARAGMLLPRPAASWHAPQARLLGRPLHPLPVPAECGGVPDPVALRETAQRARTAGSAPGLLLLSVADDPTGTAAPPALLHEVCEAASDEELLIVSDESWRDTSHDPHHTVVVSPAEMLAGTPDQPVVVLAGLDVAPPHPAVHAAVARFPDTAHGRELGGLVRDVLAALDTELRGPDAAVAAGTLAEPAPVRERRAAEAALHGAFATALHGILTDSGALCRPPQLGRHLYADLEELRPRLAAHGIEDAAGLEAELVRRLGPQVRGGHRFGDDPRGLRVRLSTSLLGTPPAPAPPTRPLELPGVPEALRNLRDTLAALTG